MVIPAMLAMCVAAGIFAETAQAAHKVALDPGHQGSWVDMSAPEPIAPGSSETKAKCTTGTTGRFTGVPEYQLNLDISLKLRDELEQRGYEIVLTREDNDTAISNIERAGLADATGCEIYVRIHANGSDDPSVHGALAMTMSPDNPHVGMLYPQSYSLASHILSSYCASTGFADLGIQQYDNMTGINWSRIPVMLLEMGFMSNQADDTAMQDSGMQDRMVQGIADGIDGYFAEWEKIEAEAETEAATEAVSEEGAEAVTEAGAEGEDTENTGIAGEIADEFLFTREAMGEKWAVAAGNPISGEFHTHNGDVVMQSASVIKLYIMGAVYEHMCYPAKETDYIPFGESYDGELRAVLEEMIQVSSNEAANRLIDALGQGDPQAGKDIVNRFCREHGYIGTHLGRKLLESEPKDDNYTTAADTAKILADMVTGKLVNEEASAKMMDILRGQRIVGKIPAGLPAGYISANKTGEMPEGYGLGCIENDAAVIYPPGGDPYILVVLSNDLAGRNDEAVQVIRDISGYVAG